jgi:hypothetical protein
MNAGVKRAVLTGVLEIFTFSGVIRRKKGHFQALKGHTTTRPAHEASLFLLEISSIFRCY